MEWGVCPRSSILAMVNTLKVGDTVVCVVRKIQANGISVSLPNGRFGYVPKYCAQSLCDADGDFCVAVGDSVSLQVKEVGQPIRLGDDGDAPLPQSREERPAVVRTRQAVPPRRVVEPERRPCASEEAGTDGPSYAIGEVLDGVVTRVGEYGYTVSLSRGGRGFLPIYMVDKVNGEPAVYRRGDRVRVAIKSQADYIRLCGEQRMARQQHKRDRWPQTQAAQRFRPMAEFSVLHRSLEVFNATVEAVEANRAVVKVGQYEGLVWRDEASWSRVDDMTALLSEGDTAAVAYIGTDPRHNRILFSLRQAQPRPDAVWQMDEAEEKAMRETDIDALSATAQFAIGDLVEASLTEEKADVAYFEIGDDGTPALAQKDCIPALCDENGRLEARTGDVLEAVVAFVGARAYLCDKGVWAAHAAEVTEAYENHYSADAVVRPLLCEVYGVGDVLKCVVRKVEDDGLVVSLPRGGVGFLPSEDMLCSPDAGALAPGGELMAVVSKATRQRISLCDKAKWDLQRLRLGSSLKDLYKPGDKVTGVVADKAGKELLVDLRGGGRGVLPECHMTQEEPRLDVGDEVEAVVFQVSQKKITLCSAPKWRIMQERLTKKPADYFKPGDKITSRVIYSLKNGIYVSLPTTGKGFIPEDCIGTLRHGGSLPRRGDEITAIVYKVTEKGVLLCDESVWERKQAEASACGADK